MSDRRYRRLPRLETLTDRVTPATFVVDTFADTVAVDPTLGTGLDANGKVSLRAAVQAAEFTPGPDTVVLAAGTYELTLTPPGATGAAGPLVVQAGEVTIDGAGSAATTIKANYTAPDAGRVLSVVSPNGAASATVVTINGVTLTGGRVGLNTGFNAGGVLNEGGVLTLTDVAVTGNRVALDGTAARGGGLVNTSGGTGGEFPGLLTLTDSVVADNAAVGLTGSARGEGGGIYNASRFNSQGTLVSAGVVTLVRTRVSGNLAQGADSADFGVGAAGGGVFNEFGSVLVIEDSEVSGNVARAGAVASATNPAGTFGGSGEGGGVFSQGSTITVVTRSLFAGNRAEGGAAEYTGPDALPAEGGVGLGGGIHVTDSLTVTNSTFSGNVAAGGAATGGATNKTGFSGGGGLFFAQLNDGFTQRLTNSTVTLNQAGFGGGLLEQVAGDGPTVGSSVVAGNLATGGNPDVLGGYLSAGNNLIGVADGSVSFDPATDDRIGADAELAPLGEYGGPTRTHALLAGSAAIDAGAQPASGDLSVDQRGLPRVAGVRIDIGAVEFAAPAAAADAFTLPAGAAFTRPAPGVLFNDLDPNGGAGLTAALVAGPQNGTLALNADGSFTYTPAAGFSGADSFTYRVTDAAGNVSDPATVTLTVTPPPPVGEIRLSASTYTVTEGGQLVVTVQRVGGSAGAVTVQFATATGSAGVADFTAATGTLSWADGETADKTFTVQTLDDSADEPDETFTVSLLSPTGGATLGATAAATATITDNDDPPTVPPPAVGEIRLSASTYTVAEGGQLVVTVRRTGGSAGPVSVQFATTGGTASAGADFTAAAGTLSWADGETADKTFTVQTLSDAAVEGAETFTITLLSPTGGATIGGATAVATITDDDQPPAGSAGTLQLSASTYTVAEGGQLVVTVRRTGGSAGPVSVQYATTAGAGVPETTGTLSWADGETADKTFTVPVPDDADVEGAETFTVTLSAPTGGAVLGATVTAAVTVTDDDQPTVPPVPPVAVPRLIGGATDGSVRVLTAADGKLTLGEPITLFAGLGVSVRVATGDVTGDGVPDFIGGTGPGAASQVQVLDGKTRAVVATIRPFEASFTGGVYVAVGDLDGDGKADVVITPDEGGGPRVDIYGGAGLTKLASFFGIDDPNFRGGARAAVGDVNADGRADLIVAAGFGGGPRVAVFDGLRVTAPVTAGGLPPKLRPDFFAFEDTLRNGAFVTAADFDGDGRASLVFGAGPGGGPRVRVVDSARLMASDAGRLDADPALTVGNFFAGDTAARGGVRVTAGDLFGTGRPDLVVGSGGGTGGAVGVYRAADLLASPLAPPLAQDLLAPFGSGVLTNGVFVG